MELTSIVKKLTQTIVLSGAISALTPPALADEPKKPQITEKQKEELEAHKYKLKDGRWSNGSISNLNPANASVDDSSAYYKAFLDIRDFLAAYDRETIPDEYRQWHDKCVDALLRNMFVPNRTVAAAGGFGRKGLNDEIREVLKKEGVLDYGKQLEHLVDLGTNVLKEAGRIATLSKPEEYEQTKEKVEALHDYVTVLQQLADATIVRALEERLRPVIHAPGEIDDARIEVIKTAREAYDHLSQLREAMDTKDASKVKTELKEWHSKLKKTLDGSQQLAKNAEEQTIFELEKPYEWMAIAVRKEHRTSDEMLATKAFAEEWGKNGEHFYSRLDRLRGIDEGFVSLKKYVEEKNPAPDDVKRAQGGMGGQQQDTTAVQQYRPSVLKHLEKMGRQIAIQITKAKEDLRNAPGEKTREHLREYIELLEGQLYDPQTKTRCIEDYCIMLASSDMKALGFAMESRHTMTGTDDVATNADIKGKLVGRYLDESALEGVIVEGLFLDPWNCPYIVEKDDKGYPIIRSLGPNGVDNHGNWDDITSCTELKEYGKRLRDERENSAKKNETPR